MALLLAAILGVAY